MNFTHTEKNQQNSQLAAEYVLGTLRGPARQRFEQKLAMEPSLAEWVDFWQQELHPLSKALPRTDPPAACRDQLFKQLMPSPAQPASQQRRSRFCSRRRLRRRASLTAAAASAIAAVVIAYLMGQRNPPTPDPLPAEVTQLAGSPAEAAPEPTSPDELLPVYVAELKIPSSQMRWLVSLSPDHREMSVVAGEDFYQVGRSRLHLWGVNDDNLAHSLGELPVQRDETTVFTVPDSLRGSQNLLLVLSLESPDEESAAHPNKGRVLWESRALDSI